MATTTILKIKQGKNKSVSATLKERIDYITNKDKTDGGILVSSALCSPETASTEFSFYKNIYAEKTGRAVERKSDILAYHIRQAFSPEDNITPEQAHKLGIELAKQFIGDQHSYVIATHIDKAHIHNHIIFNSTKLDGTGKFYNHKDISLQLREISDDICKENSLNVIETKNEKGKHYKEWTEDKKGASWKTEIKDLIDKNIQKAKSYDHFVELMKQEGCTIGGTKHITYKLQGQERCTRGRTIGYKYSREEIINRINENKLGIKRSVTIINNTSKRKVPLTLQRRLVYAIRRENKSEVQKLSEALLYIRGEGINSFKDFESQFDLFDKQRQEQKDLIDDMDYKIKFYAEVYKTLSLYNQYSKIGEKYENGNSFTKRKLYNEHENEIRSFLYAKRSLEEKGINVSVNLEKVKEQLDNMKEQNSENREDFSMLNAKMNKSKQYKVIIKDGLKIDINKKIIMSLQHENKER